MKIVCRRIFLFFVKFIVCRSKNIPTFVWAKANIFFHVCRVFFLWSFSLSLGLNEPLIFHAVNNIAYFSIFTSNKVKSIKTKFDYLNEKGPNKKTWLTKIILLHFILTDRAVCMTDKSALTTMGMPDHRPMYMCSAFVLGCRSIDP